MTTRVLKKLKQLRENLENGDCFGTCISCLTDIPQTEWPIDLMRDEHWLKRTNEIISKYDLSFFEIPFKNFSICQDLKNIPVILTGKSPRAKTEKDMHAIIGIIHDDRIAFVHDPHSSNDFIDGDPKWIGFLTLIVSLSSM